MGETSAGAIGHIFSAYVGRRRLKSSGVFPGRISCVAPEKNGKCAGWKKEEMVNENAAWDAA